MVVKQPRRRMAEEPGQHLVRFGDGVISIVRMALTAGWVVGPVCGSILVAGVGLRAMLAATACCTLAQVIPLSRMRTAPAPAITGTVPARGAEARHTAPRPGRRAMLPLLAFTGLHVLVYAGEPINYGYLPIFMRDDLRLPAGISGSVIGIQPLIELALMPVAVIIARRVGMTRLMIAGATFGANLCFALTGAPARSASRPSRRRLARPGAA